MHDLVQDNISNSLHLAQVNISRRASLRLTNLNVSNWMVADTSAIKEGIFLTKFVFYLVQETC